MKATKKLIIGLVAVIALLITIAGALAAPIATYTPNTNSNTVTVIKNQPVNFSANVPENPDADLTYQWFVNGAPVGTPEGPMKGSHISNFTFDSTNKNAGTYYVSIVINGVNPPLSNVWTVTVQEAVPASPLSVSKVEVNGKTTGKLTLSDLNKITVEVSNDHTKKIEEIVVTVRILDVDGDDLDEESDEFDLSKGEDDEVTLEFDLSNENVDEDEYTIEVEVTGEDTDSKKFSDLETITVKVDREKDDLVIVKAQLENEQVTCPAQASLDVNIKNVGENDQNGAKITVKNSALGVDLQRANIDLDDYAGSDNDYKATFALNLEDAKQGTYVLDVEVYSEDNDLMDSKEVELQVVCASAPETSKEEKGATEYYADKELAAELQQKLNEYKALQESQAASQGNFRESNSYVLLLGMLVAMMFFAAVLTATYLLVKKK
ncbi:MAG: hypothetical protein Q8R47_03705 [Nanoarchaeota archaeon]|nr:hypothetical protein [Nanoarchaeota archaeon]